MHACIEEERLVNEKFFECKSDEYRDGVNVSWRKFVHNVIYGLGRYKMKAYMLGNCSTLNCGMVYILVRYTIM